MGLNKNIVFVCLVLGVLASCTQKIETRSDTESAVYLHVAAKNFKRIIQSDEGYLIDLRGKPELTEGIIDGALHFDFFEPEFDVKVNQLDKTKPVFIYCASGKRSKHAMRTFRRLGFKEVFMLNGGIGAWAAQGFPVEKKTKYIDL